MVAKLYREGEPATEIDLDFCRFETLNNGNFRTSCQYISSFRTPYRPIVRREEKAVINILMN